MTDEFPAVLVEIIEWHFAALVSGNNMPHMSGDPRARLHPGQRRRLNDAARAALASLRQHRPDVAAVLDGWQPIETAPDRDTVLLWDRIVGVLHGWRDREGRWCHAWDSEYIPDAQDLTHWMPLPAPPRAGGGE